MPLDETQMDSVRQWIESHSPVLCCSGCGGNDWAIQSEMAFSPLIEPGDGSINTKKGYPMVALTCKNCACTMFFNAIQMGLMGRRST